MRSFFWPAILAASCGKGHSNPSQFDPDENSKPKQSSAAYVVEEAPSCSKENNHYLYYVMSLAKLVVCTDGQLSPLDFKGEPGEIGPKGDKGDSGAAGVNGANGNDGASGAAGPQGPQGAAGAAGVNGADGLRGPSGALFLYDANNNKIGTMVGQPDTERGGALVLTQTGHLGRYFIGTGQFAKSPSVPAYTHFTSGNCTGQPYVGYVMLGGYSATAASGIVLAANFKGFLTYNSFHDGNSCQVASGSGEGFWYASDYNPGFTYPFALPVVLKESP